MKKSGLIFKVNKKEAPLNQFENTRNLFLVIQRISAPQTFETTQDLHCRRIYYQKYVTLYRKSWRFFVLLSSHCTNSKLFFYFLFFFVLILSSPTSHCRYSQPFFFIEQYSLQPQKQFFFFSDSVLSYLSLKVFWTFFFYWTL